MTIKRLRELLAGYRDDLKVEFAIEMHGEPYVLLSVYNDASQIWIDLGKKNEEARPT